MRAIRVAIFCIETNLQVMKNLIRRVRAPTLILKEFTWEFLETHLKFGMYLIQDNRNIQLLSNLSSVDA